MTAAFKLVKTHFTLNFPLPMWLIMATSALMIAPNYPRMVSALFVVMLVTSLLGVMRENRSDDMLLTLPIKKSDIVKGQVLFIALIEMIYAALLALFASVAYFIPFDGSVIALTTVGMTGSVSFMGLVLAAYGVFNILFFPIYFNKGKCNPSSMFVAAMAGLLCAGALYGIFETLSQTVAPVGAVFGATSLSVLPWQIIILIAGMGAFVGLGFAAAALAVKSYSKSA